MALLLCKAPEDVTARAVVSLTGAMLVADSALLVLAVREAVRHPALRVLAVAPATVALLALSTVGAGLPAFVGGAHELSDAAWNFLYAVYILEFAAPALLMVQLFELTAAVHRARGVNFCGCVKFEEYAHDRAALRLHIVRLGVYLFTATLAILVLVHNGLVLSTMDDDAVRRANLTICVRGALTPYVGGDDAPSDELLAVGNFTNIDAGYTVAAGALQPIGLMVFASYFGVLLWRYGTYYSFEVYPTYINPWTTLAAFSSLMLVSLFVDTNGVLQLVCFLFLSGCVVYIGRLVAQESESGDSLKRYLGEQSSSIWDVGGRPRGARPGPGERSFPGAQNQAEMSLDEGAEGAEGSETSPNGGWRGLGDDGDRGKIAALRAGSVVMPSGEPGLSSSVAKDDARELPASTPALARPEAVAALASSRAASSGSQRRGKPKTVPVAQGGGKAAAPTEKPRGVSESGDQVESKATAPDVDITIQ